jgi:hypothetical protein
MLNSTPRTWVSSEVVTAALMNTEIRDAITGMQAAWTAYTPTWTALTTNPTLGNGTITGAYNRIGKTVLFRVKVTFGSTTTVGSGTYLFSPPAAVNAADALMLPARFFDSSAATRNKGIVYLLSSGNLGLAVDVGAAGGTLAGVTNASPYAWATGDTIELGGSYEAA